MNLIFLGPPGAGKGTQAAIIARERGLVHLSSGDIFRKAVQQGLEGIREYQGKGMLVPDEVAIRLVCSQLEKLAEKGFILDGFPRTINQAKALDSYLKGRGKEVNLVIYFSVPEEEVIRRLSSRRLCRLCQASYSLLNSSRVRCDFCGGELYQREDDKEEIVKNRLQVYLAHTVPLLDYYREKLVQLEGNRGIEEVSANLRQILDRCG